MSINNNTAKLQEILETINALSEAGSGVDLPELSNPASNSHILNGYEAIDENGDKIIGTMPTPIGDALIARTLTECINNTVSTIGSYAFNDCSNLTIASFPSCLYIENNAF